MPALTAALTPRGPPRGAAGSPCSSSGSRSSTREPAGSPCRTPQDAPWRERPERRPRVSLSDWYGRPSTDDDDLAERSDRSASPAKRGSGGSPDTSPTKRCKLDSLEGELPRYFIGDDPDQDAAGDRAAAELRTVVRSLCAGYFESHVSPVLQYVQQAQERLNVQLLELRAGLEAAIEDRVAKAAACRPEHCGVATLVRLQELATAVQKKPDAGTVPTVVQLREVAVAVEGQLQEVAGAVEARVEELAAVVQRKADLDGVPTRDEVSALRAEVQEARATADAASAAAEKSGVKRVQVLVAAAGASFGKQLRELREQVQELRQDLPPHERWPGRVLGSGPLSDAGSEAGSAAESAARSIPGSAAGSVAGLGSEEMAELKKVQAIVTAASTVFTRDLRNLRGQVREVSGEMVKMKGLLGVEPESRPP